MFSTCYKAILIFGPPLCIFGSTYFGSYRVVLASTSSSSPRLGFRFALSLLKEQIFFILVSFFLPFLFYSTHFLVGYVLLGVSPLDLLFWLHCYVILELLFLIFKSYSRCDLCFKILEKYYAFVLSI